MKRAIPSLLVLSFLAMFLIASCSVRHLPPSHVVSRPEFTWEFGFAPPLVESPLQTAITIDGLLRIQHTLDERLTALSAGMFEKAASVRVHVMPDTLNMVKVLFLSSERCWILILWY
jgi:hypothetical protein